MVPHCRPTLTWLDVLAVVCAFVTPAYKRGIVEVYCNNQASVTAYTSDRAQDVVGSGWPTRLGRWYLLLGLLLHRFEPCKRHLRKWTLGWPPAHKVPQPVQNRT